MKFLQTTTETTTDRKEVEAKPKPASSQFWQLQLDLSEKAHKDWFDSASRAEKRYKNERINEAKSQSRQKRMNVFYSNTETLKAALFARAAKPDVRQRHTQTQDKLGKTVAEMMERILDYCADNSEHERAFAAGVHDLTVPGRGVVRMEYEPTIGTGPNGAEVITDQKVLEKFIYYRDFRHSPAKCWNEVWWIAFRHRMTRDDLKANGFKGAETIPLNWQPDTEDKKGDCPEELKRAEVWEIWDKTKKARVWITIGHPEVLREDEDPYRLEGFWPMADPIQGITGNDSYIPRPLICQYEDQCEDLDEINDRISKLTRALKRRGVYDASIKELKRLAKAQDNEFIPAENFAAFATAGGLKQAFQTEDLKPIADALIGLYQQRDMLIQSIYEITGISDIMRGASDAGETATAQSIKAQFGSNRLKLAQKDVQRWIRDTLRLKCEIVAEHFEPQILMLMSGMQLPTAAQVQQQMAQLQMQAMASGQQPQQPPEMPVTIDDVMGVLRNDKLRSYRIDIETDSTVFEDAEAEKASRTELLQSMGGYLQQWMPVIQVGGPPMMKLAFEGLAFGVRGFKAGRQLEDAIDEARAQLEEMAANPPPAPPDPAAEELKMKQEAHGFEMDKKKAELQFQQQKHNQQLEMDLENHQTGMMAQAAKAGIDPAMIAQMNPKAQQAKAQETQAILMAVDKLARLASTPKRVIRDGSGAVVGIEPVVIN